MTIHEKADTPCRTTHPRLKTRLPRNSLPGHRAIPTKISVAISLASETLIALMTSSLYVICNGNVGPFLMPWFLASKVHTSIMKPAFGCGSFVPIYVKSWTRVVWPLFIVNKKTRKVLKTTCYSLFLCVILTCTKRKLTTMSSPSHVSTVTIFLFPQGVLSRHAAPLQRHCDEHRLNSSQSDNNHVKWQWLK